jgi:tRNA (mo5U34)-methyltransferase
MITQAEVDAFPWHHQIDFGNGVMSKGNAKKAVLQAQADIYFKSGIKGKTIVDIGCWDGFNSFEAELRGASRVLATDHFAWSNDCWGHRGAFDLAKRGLKSSVEVRDIPLDDMSVVSVGQFDIVLFLGVFYHLKNPFADLQRVAMIAKETIVVETHMDALDYPRPAMVFYPTAELANDPTNWWGPNEACVTAMLKDSGFRTVEFTVHPIYHNRGIFHGIR